MSEPRETHAERLAREVAGYTVYLATRGLGTEPLQQAAALLRQQATALATAEREREEARGKAADAAGRHYEAVHAEILVRAEQAEAALATAREAITAFLVKWDEVHPSIDSAFLIASIHGCPYGGPTLQPELGKLRVHADAPAARGEAK